MTHEIRTVCYDSDLNIEAYRFEGIMQKFPNHFHDFYVIAFVESGRRYLQCNSEEYIINAGDMLLFNPMDPHTCEQLDENALDYRCFNIRPEIMEKTVFEITGKARRIHFTQNVIYRSELAACLRELHSMILEKEVDFRKEELFLFLIEQLLQEYSDAAPLSIQHRPSIEIRTVCDYLDNNYSNAVTLDFLSKLSGFSKYHLLRSFTCQMGISPYSYLTTVRIGKAKKLLEQGVPPIEVACSIGFSDQSHFTNYFKKLIGVTPRQYMKIFSEELKIITEG